MKDLLNSFDFFGIANGYTLIPLATLLIIILFPACNLNDDVDVTAPELIFEELLPQPAEGMICGEVEDQVIELSGGDTLSFVAQFSDDNELSEYKIDIHNNFDCHGHGGGSTPSIAVVDIDNQTEDWTVLDIGSLNGNRAVETVELVAPFNVTAGNYHFHVQVVDEVGNDSPFSNFYSIKVSNPTDQIPPVISLTEPATTDLMVSKGEAVSFQGTVTDNYSLSEGGNGLVFLTYTDLSSGNTFTTDAFLVIPATAEQSQDFDLSFTVPNTLRAGDYRFTLRAHDGVRNVAAPVEFEVEVMN